LFDSSNAINLRTKSLPENDSIHANYHHWDETQPNRDTNQYPSKAGRTTVAGSRLVNMRTGDSFFSPADDDAPEYDV